MRLHSITLACVATGALLFAAGCDQQGGDSFEPDATTKPAENADAGAELGAGTGAGAQQAANTDPDQAPIAPNDSAAPGPSMEGSMTLANLRSQREYLSVPQKDSFDAAQLLFGNMKMVRQGVQSYTTGEVFNNSQFEQRNLMVIATYHRRDGSFINKAIAYPDRDVIQPGESSTFEILGDWHDEIANVRLVVREFDTEIRIPSFMMPKINR